MDPDPEPALWWQLLPEFLGDQTPYLFVILTCLALCAIMSAAEVAFFSFSNVELEELNSSPYYLDRAIVSLLQRPKYLLATQLITINLVNVAMVLVSTLMIREFGERSGWHTDPVMHLVLTLFEVVFVTFIILLFGEITPKIYASQRKRGIARFMVMPVRYLMFIFYPISWVLINSTRFIDRHMKPEQEMVTMDEIRDAIDLTSTDDSPDEEKAILKGIISFPNVPVRKIMRARVDMKAIEISVSYAEVLQAANRFGYSRIPIYEDQLDNIKGVIYTKDLIPMIDAGAEAQGEWQKLIRPAFFVPESRKSQDLMEDFKRKRLHIAIVVDEFGGTAGIVTLEDIVDEIFGEIHDEFDETDTDLRPDGEQRWIAEGKLNLLDLYKETGYDPHDLGIAEDTTADTIAGLILEAYGKIPPTGTEIKIGRLRFTVNSITRRRIKQVSINILPDGDQEDDEDAA